MGAAEALVAVTVRAVGRLTVDGVIDRDTAAAMVADAAAGLT